jgi:flavin reductase (DIM6/NTAB) family NADH-FMN oxidoreductase RutF
VSPAAPCPVAMTESPGFLFRQLTHGVYVIGVSDEGGDNAFTAAWVMQASFDPPLLAVSIHPEHVSYGMLVNGGIFSVNVLPMNREDLARHFGRPQAGGGKLDGIPWRRGRLGAPLLDGAMAHFECELRRTYAAGDHRLVLGRVRGGAVTKPDAVPMNYRDTGDMDGSSRLYPDTLDDRT